MSTIVAVEHHDQVLPLWRADTFSRAQVVHVDFHCDLRGLLINRKTQRAYRVRDRFPDVDEGNFLTHAVLEGLVSAIRWVHDEPGGRAHDLKTVKYESDLTALVRRGLLALSGDPGLPIRYEVCLHKDWVPLLPGEVLDIDWDRMPRGRCRRG
jgi:hypothetical protein